MRACKHVCEHVMCVCGIWKDSVETSLLHMRVHV